jgi:hypothetical protein
MGYNSQAFTWTNSQKTSNPIFQRLDRVLVTLSWRELYLRAQVKHLHMLYNDHDLILVQTEAPAKDYTFFSS